jgi:hypothetical protein
MAVLSTDILVKTAIEAALADLRRNEWILPDIFGGLATDPLSKHEHGYKEVAAAIEWFKKTNIPVFLDFRLDSPTMPCITVANIPRAELTNRASLGDEGSIEDYYPEENGGAIKPIKIIDNFTIKGYDKAKGTILMPEGLTTEQVVAGQFMVSQASGKAYEILQVLSNTSFKVKPNIQDNLQSVFIAPPVSLWNLHRELTFVQESVSISCNTSGNPVECQWLHDLLWYALLRYKEVYLEGRGFELSTLVSGEMMINQGFSDADRIFTRVITLTGQLEVSWVKYIAPRLHSIKQAIVIADGPKTPPTYKDMADNQGWKMAGDIEPTKETKNENEDC